MSLASPGDESSIRVRRRWPRCRHRRFPPAHGFHDECLKGEVRFSLGLMKPTPPIPFGNDGSFGSPGSGGSMGFADPESGIGYAYVTSQMGTKLTGDPRDLALRQAVYAIISGIA